MVVVFGILLMVLMKVKDCAAFPGGGLLIANKLSQLAQIICKWKQILPIRNVQSYINSTRTVA